MCTIWGLYPKGRLITRLLWKPVATFINRPNWALEAKDGNKFCSSLESNSQAISSPPSPPHCIVALGITPDVWHTKCRKSGPISNAEILNLEANLDLLEQRGMTYKGRKRVVQKSVKSLFLPAPKVDLHLNALEHILDLQQKQVMHVVRKYPEYLVEGMGGTLSHFLESFSQGGHEPVAVQNMVIKHPQILGRVKQFESISSYFIERLQCSQAQVMAAFIKYPQLVGACLENQIKPKVLHFEGLGLSKAQILAILIAHPETMCSLVQQDVLLQIDKFHALGISEENVAKIIRGCPLLLFRNFESCILEKLDWLEMKMFFRKETALKALVNHPRIFPASLETWKSTCEFYLDSGMSRIELSHFMKRCPKLLSRKKEGMEEKFQFAKTVLKKGSLEVLRSVRYFTYSFENRILFRAALTGCAGKDITKPSFRDLLDPSDADFRKRFPEGEYEKFRARWNQMTKEEKLDRFQFKLYS